MKLKGILFQKMINDLISETKKIFLYMKPRSADDIRKMKKPLVTFSKEMKLNIKKLEVF